MVPATDEPKGEAEKDNATSSLFKAVEALTKGIEIPLPAGYQFQDNYGPHQQPRKGAMVGPRPRITSNQYAERAYRVGHFSKAPKCLPPAAFTGQVFHRLAAQVTDAQLKNAQIEIARTAVRHFALSADAPAFDTTTLNHSHLER